MAERSDRAMKRPPSTAKLPVMLRMVKRECTSLRDHRATSHDRDDSLHGRYKTRTCDLHDVNVAL